MNKLFQIFVLFGFLALFSNCKNERLVGTPEVSQTEEVVLVQQFQNDVAPPTFNDYTYIPSTSHDGFGRVPDTQTTTEKVSLTGKWYSATLKKTGEAVNVFIVSNESYNRGDTVTVSLREYNEGFTLVGPYSPAPVANSAPKPSPEPKGKADWTP